MKHDLLKGHLDLLLLATIAPEPAHGYAIITKLRERSDGAFDLPEGTIYPSLHRLERNGLLAGRWVDAAGRNRRVYELTAAGREALRERSEAWRSFAAGVRAVVGPDA